MVLLACDVRHTQLGFERSERNEEEKEKDKKKEKEKKASFEKVGGNFEKGRRVVSEMLYERTHIQIIQQPRAQRCLRTSQKYFWNLNNSILEDRSHWLLS